MQPQRERWEERCSRRDALVSRICAIFMRREQFAPQLRSRDHLLPPSPTEETKRFLQIYERKGKDGFVDQTRFSRCESTKGTYPMSSCPPQRESRPPCVKLQTPNRQKKQVQVGEMKFFSVLTRTRARTHTHAYLRPHRRTSPPREILIMRIELIYGIIYARASDSRGCARLTWNTATWFSPLYISSLLLALYRWKCNHCPVQHRVASRTIEESIL